MNPLSALYFPDTVPDPGELARLLLFFDTIYHYRPNEATAAEQSETGALTDRDAPCRSYPPVPFGDDLEEFRRLVKKLKSRPHIPGELSSLSLAALSSGLSADKDEKSSSSLLTAILGKNIPAQEESQELWQARLILKLAEIYDLEEREVNQGLSEIDDQEQQLFESLLGRDGNAADDPHSFPDRTAGARLLSDSGYSATSLAKNRLKAWGRLFVADPNKRPWLLTTASRDAADQLFANHAKLPREKPAELFTLPLPDLKEAGWSDPDYIKLRSAFKKAVATILPVLGSLLEKAAQTDGPPAEYPVQKELEAWQTALVKIFGVSVTLNKQLVFYCFPKSAPAELLGQKYQPDPVDTSPPTSNQNSILALATDVPSQSL